MLPLNVIIPQIMKAQGGKPALAAAAVDAHGPKGATGAVADFLSLLAAHLQKLDPAAAVTTTDPATTTVVENASEGLDKNLLLLAQSGLKMEKTPDGGLLLAKDGKKLAIDGLKLKNMSVEELSMAINQAFPQAVTADSGLLAQLLAGDDGEPDEISPSVLGELKAKVDALDLSKGAVNHETLVTFKNELKDELTAKGFDQATINRYMVALAKMLKSGQESAGTTPVTGTAPDTMTELVAELMAKPAAPAQDEVKTQTDSSSDSLPPVMTTAEAMTASKQDAETKKPANASTAELPPFIAADASGEDNPEQRIMTLLGRHNRPEAAHPPLPANAAPEAQANAAANAQAKQIALPAQSAALRTPAAGFGASDMSFADGNGNSSGNGANLGNSGLTDTLGGGLSKSGENVKSGDNKGFSNYMSAMRSYQNPVTQMVNVNLMRGIHGKVNSLTVQLDPVELGKVEIRLKLDAKNAAKVHMTVDKPETLAMLQKDSALLERTLKDAGIETDDASLSFDLRQQNPGFEQREAFNSMMDGHGRNDDGDNDDFGAMSAMLATQIAIQTTTPIDASGVNIMV